MYMYMRTCTIVVLCTSAMECIYTIDKAIVMGIVLHVLLLLVHVHVQVYMYVRL